MCCPGLVGQAPELRRRNTDTDTQDTQKYDKGVGVTKTPGKAKEELSLTVWYTDL